MTECDLSLSLFRRHPAPRSGVYTTMKSIPAAVGVIVTVLLCFCSAAASSSAAQGTTAKPDPKQGGAQERTATTRKSSDDIARGCEINKKQSESQERQIFEWDPINCLHCPKPGEPAIFFLFGLLLAAPIFLWVIRTRTRKR